MGSKRINLFMLYLPIIFICYSAGCVKTRTSSSVKAALEKADLVFIGKLIRRDTLWVSEEDSGFKEPMWSNRLIIGRLYKGNCPIDTLTVLTLCDESAPPLHRLSIPFKDNVSYIVYANYKEEYFRGGSKVPQFIYTDVLSRTRVETRKEIAEIEKYRKPVNCK
jgi:hypothetical protein